ncbi:hypothetical protein HUJ05_002327 [Dendroctonus ponderosae]|nr:hypothetical protein HUJ05_002327 [Dendroctonus ponderosae]
MFWLLLVGFFAVLECTAGDILVTTPKGTVRGRSLLSPANRTFYGFTGIPFAKPPVGELRFQAPVEADPWEEIIDAIADPDKCFQVNSDSDTENENCLYVNVFTPQLELADSITKLPVVLGIYGGSFRSGSAGYGRGGPDWFIERDIVVVNFNYRVGPFGFLSTGDTVIPGNAGLKDQQLALQWTYENIELFGGNKSHITLQGQSAGGASVTYQLLNQKSAGMVKHALVESGSALCPWAWTRDNLPYTIRLAKTVNDGVALTNTSTAFLLEFLQSATARQVDAASAALYSSGIPLPTLEPEHEGAFITQPMYELVEAGDVVKVPLFIGINSEEYIGKAANIPSLQVEAQGYDQKPLSIVPWQFDEESEENRLAIANLIKGAYVGEDTFAQKLGSTVSYDSDSVFTKSIIRFAELYAKYSPVYFYQFSYKGEMGIYQYSIEGADNVAHGEESHYLSITKAGSFDNTKYDNFPASDVITHWRLIELWSNFYKYGNPTPEPVELLSNLIWPVVSEDNFVYLNINETLELKDTPKSPRYNAWRSAFNNYGQRPFIAFDYLPIRGPVKLKGPDVGLQYIEFYGTRAVKIPTTPYEVFFGRNVASGLRQLLKKLSLKTRKFIGNTSMDPQLSLLMANQAQVNSGSIILGPFVGYGSLLVAVAEFGVYVFESDIDYLMLHGKTKPTRIKQQKRAKDESIKANIKQYNLSHKYIDVLINDFSLSFWRDSMEFDAIITDPPYGIREATERVGTEKQNYIVSDEHLPTHVPAKIEYGIPSIYRDLLIFASKHLRLEGRLVCWFPVFREDYTEKCLPRHPCLTLIANSEQPLSKVTSRRLLTYKKVKRSSVDELNIKDANIQDFRDKYFVVREECRRHLSYQQVALVIGYCHEMQ